MGLVRRYSEALVITLATVVIAALAVYRLRVFPYPLSLEAAMAGAAVTAQSTVPAAVRTWLLVGVMLAVLARVIGRRVPEWSGGERTAAALVVLWSLAYVALLALGPVGLYRAPVLRGVAAALVVGSALVARRAGHDASQAREVDRRDAAGPWLMGLVLALTVGPLLILQLASPVSPFMDILGYIAPVQKIVTFEFYDPYANDAAGLWSPTRQVVGFDAAFSFIALAAGLPAHLAMSSLIVPFAVLQLLAAYLLARAAGGRVAGGMTALFLLMTFVWRRTPDIRSTGLAFPLVAIGLAFLLHGRRDGRRAAAGGLALGVAVTVNPLIGAAGMQVAAAMAVLEWLDRGRGALTPALALAGGSVFALPQVLVGLAVQVPPSLMPLVAVVGLAALGLVARIRREEPCASARRRPLSFATAALLPFTVLFLHARRSSELFNDTWAGYPLLWLVGLGGVAVAARDLWRGAGSSAAAVAAVALWLGILDHALADPRRFFGPLEMRSSASEVTTKMAYYWSPYWLAIGAGVWCAMLARRWSLVGATVLALVLVVYPYHLVPEPVDFDTQELSVAETWGFQLANAARGYHAGRPDRRWVVDARWRQLTDVLMQERAAGRIDYRTHVLEITPLIDTVELALWTGISVDLITPQYDPQSIWTGSGRARGMDALAAALARRPPYVVVRDFSPERFGELSQSYEELLTRPGLRLYRLREGAAPPEP